MAQNDAIPRGWEYATNVWKANEIVRDVISLPLNDVSPGLYELRVGLYNELTGQRLFVTPHDLSTPQEYLLLQTLEHE